MGSNCSRIGHTLSMHPMKGRLERSHLRRPFPALLRHDHPRGEGGVSRRSPQPAPGGSFAPAPGSMSQRSPPGSCRRQDREVTIVLASSRRHMPPEPTAAFDRRKRRGITPECVPAAAKIGDAHRNGPSLLFSVARCTTRGLGAPGHRWGSEQCNRRSLTRSARIRGRSVPCWPRSASTSACGRDRVDGAGGTRCSPGCRRRGGRGAAVADPASDGSATTARWRWHPPPHCAPGRLRIRQWRPPLHPDRHR